MKNITEPIRLTEEYGHLTVTEKAVDSDYPIHWHTYFEIEYICEGEGVHNLNGKETKISSGALYIITPTDFHALKTLKPIKLINISFDESVISPMKLCALSSPHLEKSFYLSERTAKTVVALAEILKTESETKKENCSRELCESILTILLRQRSEPIDNTRLISDGIERALTYLNLNFRDDPSLECVAAHAGLHPHYFSELFKKRTGENFSRYLSSLKIKYAKTMLSAGFSVTETCHRSGFGSPSSFLTAFKREVGKSPKDYKLCKK